MTSVLLQFLAEGGAPQLVATKFSSALLERELVCLRGKVPVGTTSAGSFLWSAGVVGASAAFVKAKLAFAMDASRDDWMNAAGLNSEKSNPAISLDYALSKQPNWLLDMFGSDSRGFPLIKRIFLRSNPERKRIGPVVVAINPAFLNPSQIKIEVDGQPIEDVSSLAEILNHIESGFDSSLAPVTRRTRRGKDESPGRALVTNPDSDDGRIADSAISDVSRALGAIEACCPTSFPWIARNVEADLPRSLALRLALSLHGMIGEKSQPIVGGGVVFLVPRSGVVSIRSLASVDNPRILSVMLESKDAECCLLSECQIDGDSPFVGIRVLGPRSLKQIAPILAREASIYCRQAQSHLRDCLAAAVRRFNPPVVDRLYGILRRYLSASGVIEEALSEFSIFAHIRGRARYLLDDIRYRGIQRLLRASTGASWSKNDVVMNRSVETEAWYSTSVVNSLDTMSYTEAILPSRTWCGTPDLWKRPIPGFGASEIAVYGMARTWAEPLNLKASGSKISFCAVFREEHSSGLKGKFQRLPSGVGEFCVGSMADLTRIPVGKKALHGFDSQMAVNQY